MFSFGKDGKSTQKVSDRPNSVVTPVEPCDECKKVKAIYKVRLCEDCYTELFK